MFGITLALLLAVAQAPQEPAEARCILDQIPAADRLALGESASRAAETLGPPGERIRESALSCGRRLGWTRERIAEMAALSLSLVLRDEASRMLAAADIQTARIDRWFEAQSLAVRTEPSGMEDATGRLVETLLAEGVPLAALEARGQLVGVYFGARLMIERFERGLPLGD